MKKNNLFLAHGLKICCIYVTILADLKLFFNKWEQKENMAAEYMVTKKPAKKRALMFYLSLFYIKDI